MTTQIDKSSNVIKLLKFIYGTCQWRACPFYQVLTRHV